MNGEERSYLTGMLCVTIGAGSVYWPAGLIACGFLLMLPRWVEWFDSLRNGVASNGDQ